MVQKHLRGIWNSDRLIVASQIEIASIHHTADRNMVFAWFCLSDNVIILELSAGEEPQ